MSDQRNNPQALTWNRRRFLRYSSVAALGSALGTLAAPAAQALAPERRTLRFVHTHTGEKLVAPYSQGGCYLPECLDRVSHFLRDFRTGESYPIDPGLLDILYDLQIQADREDAFQIISGYRSPATNSNLRSKSKGVAERSLHMQGKALDIRLTGFSTRKLRDLALSLQRGGVGYYASSDFLHIDTGRVRFW